MNTVTAPASFVHLLDSFDPISLAQVEQNAGLMTRRDRKYLLPEGEIADLLTRLSPDTRVLQIGDHRIHGYSSTYFDTDAMDSYLQGERRRRRRFKVRTRTYTDTGTCWLEVKTRTARGTTVKVRRPHPVGHPGELSADGRGFVRDVLLDQHIPATSATRLIADLDAVLTVRYHRIALVLPCLARATIDLGLTWSEPDGTGAALTGHAVVETKTGPTRGASSLDRILWQIGHRPRSLSKYAVGMASLSPDLPHHRWHRVLTSTPIHRPGASLPTPIRSTP